jgi:hypothetical protein
MNNLSEPFAGLAPPSIVAEQKKPTNIAMYGIAVSRLRFN